MAVIIILAIVALVATPTILNVINDVKDSSRKSSLAMYADAVKLAVTDDFFENELYPIVDKTWVDTNVEYGGERITCTEINYDLNGVYLNDCQVGNYEDEKYCFINGNVFSGENCLGSSLATPESCFTFDSATGTITGYDEACGLDVVIPKRINNVNVTNIGPFAFVFNKTDVMVGYYSSEGKCSELDCYYEIPYDVFIENNIDNDIDYMYSINTTSTLMKICYNENISEDDIVDVDQLYSIDDGYSRCEIFLESGDSIFLNMGSGNIETVDFSNAIYLETIGHSSFLSNNISSLNLTNLNNLKEIKASAFEYNHLSSLDLSECTNLQVIEGQAFAGNGMSGELDLSECTNLQSIELLAFAGNHLSSLDLTNLTNLTSLSGFQGNQITSLDLGDLTSLTSIGSTAFLNNQISALDLTSLINLTSLSGFGGNQISGELDLSGLINLKEINLFAFRDNQLNAINLSELTNLEKIEYGAFKNNQLTSLDFTDCTSLKEIGNLAFDNNPELSAEDVIGLSSSVKVGTNNW